MRTCLTLLLAAGLFLPVRTFAAEPPPTDAQRAAALIERLGSEDYQERQAAVAALDRLGAAALPALRGARKHLDPEVRRQVAQLLPILERRAETARQFDTPRLRLHYENVPLADVLADLSKRSGNPLKLGADELGKRRITLDGDWTFWEALDHVCAAGGVREPEPEEVTASATPQIEEGGGFRRGGRRFLYMSSLRGERSVMEVETITLTDGAPGRRAAFQAGALRIRMLGPRASYPTDDGGDKRHVALALEVKPEPRIGWERLAAVRIDRVVDDKGQHLPAPAVVLGDNKLQEIDENVIIIWDSPLDFPLAAAPQLFALQFPLNDRTGIQLREVRGTVAGWIRTAPQPLITLDNLAKQVNKTQTGTDGTRLTVTECRREEDGLYKVSIELTPPQNPQLADLLNRHIVRANRRFSEKLTTALDASSPLPFVLSGDQGEALALVNGTCVNDSNGTSRVYTLIYKPDKNDKGPAKVVYRDRRSAFIEVPFVLKDVPLYKSDGKP